MRNTLENIVRLILDFKIDGVILTNTTDGNRQNLLSNNKTEVGGLSGKPLRNMSTKLIKRFYKDLKDKVPIIGVGGLTQENQPLKK